MSNGSMKVDGDFVEIRLPINRVHALIVALGECGCKAVKSESGKGERARLATGLRQLGLPVHWENERLKNIEWDATKETGANGVISTTHALDITDQKQRSSAQCPISRVTYSKTTMQAIAK